MSKSCSIAWNGRLRVGHAFERRADLGSAPAAGWRKGCVARRRMVCGSVSGGYVEVDLIDRVRRTAFVTGPPQRVLYGVSTEEAWRFDSPSGGTIELVLELLRAADPATIDWLSLAIPRVDRRGHRLSSNRV